MVPRQTKNFTDFRKGQQDAHDGWLAFLETLELVLPTPLPLHGLPESAHGLPGSNMAVTNTFQSVMFNEDILKTKRGVLSFAELVFADKVESVVSVSNLNSCTVYDVYAFHLYSLIHLVAIR